MYEIHLLNTFLVRNDRGWVIPLQQAGARLVAYLALAGQRQRLTLASALWPDLPTDRGLPTLRTVLSRTRRAAPELLKESGQVVEIHPNNNIDYTRTYSWAVRALAADDSATIGSEITSELLPAWDQPWLDSNREEYRVLRLAALEAVASRSLQSGNLGSACRHALMALRIDPSRECATRVLIEVHLREGNQNEALRRYRHFRETTEDLFPSGPSPSLQALVAPLLINPLRDVGEVALSRSRRMGPRRAS